MRLADSQFFSRQSGSGRCHGQVSMQYVSTWGEAPVLGFSDALLAGLARDGGLYVPEAWPQLDAATIEAFAGQPYHAVAQRVISPFVGDDLEPTTFASMV